MIDSKQKKRPRIIHHEIVDSQLSKTKFKTSFSQINVELMTYEVKYRKHVAWSVNEGLK